MVKLLVNCGDVVCIVPVVPQLREDLSREHHIDRKPDVWDA